jgi:hypothetical protein
MARASAHAVHSAVLGALIAIAALACGARPDRSLEQRFAELGSAERMAHGLPERQRITAIAAGYDRMVAPLRAGAGLGGITDDGLAALVGAARLAAFYTHEPAHARDLASFVGALSARGLASATDYQQLYETLVGARLLGEAGALAAQHPLPGLEPLPALREAPDLAPGQPTEWVVDPDRRELVRRTADLRAAVQILVISHPMCHFSQAAMRDIEADPALRAVFAAHAHWIAPQDNRLRVDVFGRWNRQHPGQETALAYRRDEWPMLDTWSTPTFYVLAHGAVVAKVEGWPKGGRRAELASALRRAGLVP